MLFGSACFVKSVFNILKFSTVFPHACPLLTIRMVSEVHLKHLLHLLRGQVSQFSEVAVVHGVWTLSYGKSRGYTVGFGFL